MIDNFDLTDSRNIYGIERTALVTGTDTSVANKIQMAKTIVHSLDSVICHDFFDLYSVIRSVTRVYLSLLEN